MKEKMVRVQLDITEARFEELKSLMAKTQCSTRKDVFENALCLLDWAVKESEAGKVIGSRGKDKDFREVIMPALLNARKRQA